MLSNYGRELVIKSQASPKYGAWAILMEEFNIDDPAQHTNK